MSDCCAKMNRRAPIPVVWRTAGTRRGWRGGGWGAAGQAPPVDLEIRAPNTFHVAMQAVEEGGMLESNWGAGHDRCISFRPCCDT